MSVLLRVGSHVGMRRGRAKSPPYHRKMRESRITELILSGVIPPEVMNVLI